MTRGDVHLVRLDPTLGSEIKKTRPCVVVSPDELNAHLRTAVVAPMTTGGKAYPWRIRCRFEQGRGAHALSWRSGGAAKQLLLGQRVPCLGFGIRAR